MLQLETDLNATPLQGINDAIFKLQNFAVLLALLFQSNYFSKTSVISYFLSPNYVLSPLFEAAGLNGICVQ